MACVLLEGMPRRHAPGVHRLSHLAGRLLKKASIPVPANGSVRLAVVSDTHSQPHPATVTRLAEIAPDAILQAGDIGDLKVLDELARIAPVYAVRGNIDTHARGLPDALVLDVAS